MASAAACHTLTAEQEEGPYYVAVDKVRDHISLGENGLPFRFDVTIINTSTCKPLKHAAVDIWHCHADGVYSDESAQSTRGQTWLRGVQFTDKHGQASFHSIYPGHYNGRTTRSHVKVHTNSTDRNGKLINGHVAHTGNLFPPEAVNATVYRRAPYSADTARILTHCPGHGLQPPARLPGPDAGTPARAPAQHGLIGQITLGVDPRATPALIGIHS